MEPIAIVGIGCRFPGDGTGTHDLDTPAALWAFLQRGGDAYSDFPVNRINVDAWYHPQQGRPGSFYTRGGCFLKQDPRCFDPSMFGISPQEARTLDPAQRKLLETVYEAFESSGTPLVKLHGSSTGCFIGNFNYDHQLMQFRDADFPEPYAMTGGGIALLSNRISYIFDLHGPSLTLDTACSSSMYALHLACSAIESGECNAAIVGGSNLILTPECQTFSAALGAVSRSSKCHTFDAAADGYARAEGIGVLYIKKLTQAMQDGDPIRAVIRATAINANGRTGGITHPDPSGQERAMRRAYQRAGHLDPAHTSYFECHGTGTPIGDPLEVEAVGRVFAADRTAENPLYIGSVKSNIGHCEAASGIAGIIKAVLAIEHGKLPPIRALHSINPNVNLHGGRLHIVEDNMPWPQCAVRRASVNSFGYGGANAHTILEEADHLAPGRSALKSRFAPYGPKYSDWTPKTSLGSISPVSHMSTSPTDSLMTAPIHDTKLFETALTRSQLASKRCFLLPLSAHNEQTLRGNIEALLPRVDQWHTSDLAYTLGCRRSALSARTFVIATRDETRRLAFDPDHCIIQRARPQNNRVGFVFTGQGAQWPEMAKDLMDTFHVYLESIRQMDIILNQLTEPPDWSIEQALQAPSEVSRVHDASLSQPLVTAVQIALVDLLTSWRIMPSTTVGHSSGEIAAAYAAGHLSAAEAIVIAYARGRAVSKNTRHGAMLAVAAGAEAMRPLLSEYPAVDIACYNSPESVTLSGDSDSIHAVKAALDSQGEFARILQTGGNAYHSSQMKAVGREYEIEVERMLQSLHTKQRLRSQPLSTFISSVTAFVEAEQLLKASYWRQNLESPVLFDQAVTSMIQSHSVDFVVEIGPHSALRGPVRQITQVATDITSPIYMPTITRHEDSARGILHTAGTLWSKGLDIDFNAINSGYRADTRYNNRVIVDLPKYQWHYNDLHYTENRWTREWRLKTHPHHDLLGSRQPGGNHNEPMWRNILKIKHVPWLKDHQIGSDFILPAAAYLAMATEAALQMTELKGTSRADIASCYIEKVKISTALTIPDNLNGVEILFNLRRSRLDDHSYHDSRYEFTVTSVTPSGESDIFTEHAHGNITTRVDVPQSQSLGSQESNWKPNSAMRWYDTFAKIGLNYGPAFQCLADISTARDQRQSKCVLVTNRTKSMMNGESIYNLHPTALDAAVQLAIVAAYKGRAVECTSPYMPISLDKMTIAIGREGTASMRAVASASFLGSGNITADVSIINDTGELLLSFGDFQLVRAEGVIPPPAHVATHPFSRMIWKPDINMLTTENSSRIFLSSFDQKPTDGACSPMDNLALHLVIRLFHQHPTIFSTQHADAYLDRFASWMKSKVHLAQTDTITGGRDAFNKTATERDVIIKHLIQEASNAHGPESRLMCHMVDSYPSVFRGEISGIQAAVHSNLLSDTYEHMLLYHRGSQALGEVISLISHRQPKIDVFEIGAGTGSAAREILQRLRGDGEFRGYNSYTFTDVTPSFLAAAQAAFQHYAGVHYAAFNMEKPTNEQGFDKTYDVVVASNVIHVAADMKQTLINIRRLLKPGGKLALFEIVRATLAWVTILGTFPGFWNGDHDPGCPRTEGPFLTLDMWRDILPKCGFSGVDVALDHFAEQKDAAVILATAVEDNAIPATLSLLSNSVTIVYREDTPSVFCLDFQRFAQASGLQVEFVPLQSCSDLPMCHIICVAEVERSLFTDFSAKEWEGVKSVLLNSTSTVWVTRGGLLHGKRPEHAMISGLIAAAHVENSSCRALTLDLDLDDADQVHHFANILLIHAKAMNYSSGNDVEYRSRSGILYTSRLMEDEILNQAQDGRPSVDPLITNALNQSSKYSALPTIPLPEDDIEILVKASSVEAMDPTRWNQSLGLNISGTVTLVGSSVNNFKPGDHVFGLCSRLDGNTARTRAQFCHSMRPAQSFAEAASAVSAQCTALYGVQDASRLTTGECIFVRVDDPTVRLMACLAALDLTASVFTLVSSEEEKSRLLSQAQSLMPEHVLVNTGQDMREEIHQRTKGNRMDVVLSDASDNCVELELPLLAPFGRYVRIQTPGTAQSATLAITDSSKCTSYTSFSLDQISRICPGMIQRLLERTHAFRIATQTFVQDTGHCDEVNQIIAPASLDSGVPTDIRSNIEQCQTSLNVPSIAVPTVEPTADFNFRRTRFDPEASYLLVGCLGGLGKSFSHWMVSNGAQNLIFLSRSGVDEIEAAEFVTALQDRNIKVQVVRGDVTIPEDVRRAVALANGQLKGIVQAPLTLHDALLHLMSIEDFNATIRPRVIGSFNLHEETRHMDLDFFMMWSSWTKILGSTSQANYMASCAFMDAFAVHRQYKGLPATSLSLGHMLDVGIVSHHLSYQEHLSRMGLHGNSENEFLRFCEVGISGNHTSTNVNHTLLGQGHLLAGLEPASLAAHRSRYPVESMHWFRDPRFSHLLFATERLMQSSIDSRGAQIDAQIAISDDDVGEPLLTRIHKRVARCLYLAVEDIDVRVPITNYGIDSMVAAQVRNWTVTALGADVSLFFLLHPTTSIERLAAEVEKNVQTKNEDA